MKSSNHNLVCSIVALGVGLLTSTAFGGNQQELATSIKGARIEATRTHEQLESTLSALNALTKQKKGDLRPAYDAFAAEIPRTEAAANSTRTRVKWMAGEGQQYFEGWQKEINGIANESLRKKAQKRLNAVKKSYDKVAVELSKGAEKFSPFLSDLNDIKKTLANDVTPSGVKAIRSTVSSANWNYKYVDTAINGALSEMAKMEKALSTEVK